MKVEPEKILLDCLNVIKNKNIFLIAGNEVTLIKEIESHLLSNLKKEDSFEVLKFENKKMEARDIESSGLFSLGFKILIYYEPKELDLEFLEKIKDDKLVVIIVDTKIKNSSKIKKSFDINKNYITINCYKLTLSQKEVILNSFLKNNSIDLESDSYWYFVNQTDFRYGLFYNEIKKLYIFSKEKASIEKIRLLISNSDTGEVDRLFFSILKNNKEIFVDSRKTILSYSDSQLLLQKIKFFINILLETKNVNEANTLFPKYLFKQKDLFLNIVRKTNHEKIFRSLALIKKTEFLLRQNPSLYFIVSQRLLVNLKKNLI